MIFRKNDGWMRDEVYITGAGIISAIGNDREEVLRSLLEGRSGIAGIRLLRSGHHELPCGEVRLSNEALRRRLCIPDEKQCNRTTLLGIEAIRQALEQANIDATDAVLISGTTVGGMDDTERHFLDMQRNDDFLPWLDTHNPDSTTERMAEYFGIPKRNAITISTACSSAANAFITGANMIKAGEAEVVIVGGSEALSLFHLNGFNSLMILDNRRCRPFDETRKGLNLGEGAAFMVLESASSVERRGGKPLALLSGYGNTCDAFHQTASSENGEGAYLAMMEALSMAGLQPEDIDYVNAHGTGTPNNDLSESNALRRVFPGHLPPVSSTKSFTGHATSASGGIEMVICLLALSNQFIPANLGWETQIPGGITPSLGQTGIKMNHVMCNSFGFGGNDSSLILSNIGCRKEMHSQEIPAGPVSYKVRSTFRSTPENPMDNLKEFISPMESRRLCKLLKTAMMTSLSALREAGIEIPDAILVGTSYGMLENSEKILQKLCEEGEQGVSPTLFMQSTHNTIAGALAIHTRSHGYNVTYTGPEEREVLDLCLRDALRLMRQGKIKNALIGYHNEVTPALQDMVFRLRGVRIPVGITSVAMVIEKQ